MTGTLLWQTPAPGAVQTAGPCAGTSTVSSQHSFFGEPALDDAGNLYIASTDSAPAGCPIPLGTLAKLDPNGQVLWARPLVGAVSGAVVVAGNAVLATTRWGQVAAFGLDGAPLWSYLPGVTRYEGSAAVDVGRGVVYAVTGAGMVQALNLSTGQPISEFGSAGSVALAGEVTGSPVVDGAGTLYVADSRGTLYALDPQGRVLFAVETGAGAAAYLSPAIDGSGTVYVGGNLGRVVGLHAGPLPTATPTNTTTPVADPTATVAPGTDLVAWDTEVEHYTQGQGGLVDLQLYNSPAGVPGPSGWQYADTTLGTPTPSPIPSLPPTPAATGSAPVTQTDAATAAAPALGRATRHAHVAGHPSRPAPTPQPRARRPARHGGMQQVAGLATATALPSVLVPAHLPFELQFAPDTSGPALATLTNESGVTLSVGLSAINGAAPAVVAGSVAGNAITYTAPVVGSDADVALRATAGCARGPVMAPATPARSWCA